MNTSMTGLPYYVPSLIAAVLIPTVIAIRVHARKQLAANLRSLAAQLRLDFTAPAGWFGNPRASGELRGKLVEVFIFATGSGKSRQTWAALTVRPENSDGFNFSLQKQGFATKVMELFGTHEITVGDPAFDAAWFIRTNRPEFFRAALIPELRGKLMTAYRNFDGGKFEIRDGVVKYFEPGSFYSAQQAARFAAVADVVGDLADVAEVAAKDGPR